MKRSREKRDPNLNKTNELHGLSSNEALRQRKKYGSNALPEEKSHPLVIFLQKFWAPIPWMLELIIVLQLTLGKFTQAWIIFILLVFNAALSFFQEDKAKKALLLLKRRLSIQARILRDGQWKLLPAEDLVPEDIIFIQMGDILPADVILLSGRLSIDQSALTGESLPANAEEGNKGYAGSIIKHGEAYAKVLATGKNTYYGKTAEIMLAAKRPSHLQQTIFQIIKYLISFDALLVLIVFVYAVHHQFLLADTLAFCLLLLVASVPVALPAMYTLSTALGSLELGKAGVLVTHLTAIEEAAGMTVLCVDKTGTITKNTLEVTELHPYEPYSQDDLLVLAFFACEEATQDPIDLAIIKAAQNLHSSFTSAKKESFIPFDPARKCTEAVIIHANKTIHVLMGLPSELLKKAGSHEKILMDVEKMGETGARVLAVAVNMDGALKPVGLIACLDLPREDAKKSIEKLQALGIKVIMITGDSAPTARAIAAQVGLGTQVIHREELEQKQPDEIAQADIIAGVFPEDKFKIIQQLQKKGHICGMTGDGVNDAPALKKAEVGIAMSNATDVAKASASLILTRPGLEDVIEAIKTSRRIYQRMLTYTLNKIIKTLEISVLLGLGLILFNNFIISQLLIVLLLIANDFMTMSIATDNVSYSQKPERWNIRKLTGIGGLFAFFTLALSFMILFTGERILHLFMEQIRTLIFLTLVLTGQATIYLVRERDHFWHSRPSSWMISSSLLDISLVVLLASFGILMAPLKISTIAGLVAAIGIYFILLDFLKVKVIKLSRLMARNKVF